MPSNNISNFFNKYLKGKYAFWIHMRYIVPFDTMGYKGYIAVEEDINKLLKKEDGTYPKPYGCEYIDIYNLDGCMCDIMKYVDIAETDRINNISIFKIKNNNTSDSDITIDDLKLFREWLAKELLNLNIIHKEEFESEMLDDSTKHMLEYYANNMNDDVIKYLAMYSNINTFDSTVKSCCCSNNIMELNESNVSNICDSVKSYKYNLYKKMVDTFSDISFWTQWDKIEENDTSNKSFISLFKQYIDNIIKVGLKINNKIDNKSIYSDCVCDDHNNDNNIIILKRLSDSLNYILNNQIVGHKNFIKDSLYDWASKLYEYMHW